MNSDPKAFSKLLEEGREPLWHGCTKHTKLSAVAILLNIKTDHNISHECFESLLKAIKSMLPDNEKVPDNYYYYKNMVKKSDLGYQKIDACPHDCMLFYKKNEKITKCTIYGHDRATLMWTISNFRAYGMLSGWSIHGKLACLYCMDHTKSFTLQKGRNLVNLIVIAGSCRKITHSEEIERTSGQEFPYWSTNLIRHNLDVMHVEKNVFENVFNTMMNVTWKTKDNDKARLDLKDICKRSALELQEFSNGKTVKPHASIDQGQSCPRNDDGGNIELNGRVSVFGLSGRAYGKGKSMFLSEKDLHAAHTYILPNYEEIDKFVRLYDDELKVKCPGITDKDIQINCFKDFTRWIKNKALIEGLTIPANVQSLAMGLDMDQNWPTPAITWASTPVVHKDAIWAEFQKHYRWEENQGPVIATLFWQKCDDRTKDNLSRDSQKALINAGIDHPNHAMENMHKYSPWWCTTEIWKEMCNQWRDEKWLKKRKTASSNRVVGGEKAKGTYKGDSISQLQHIVNRESESQVPINWVDVYVKTRDGLPEAANYAENYHRLYDERYPEGIERPYFDQNLWEMVSIVKKNYFKGQGQRRCPSISGSSFSTQF
ncbi:hypothetical protein AgCh_009299 [Apium graveolens]